MNEKQQKVMLALTNHEEQRGDEHCDTSKLALVPVHKISPSSALCTFFDVVDRSVEARYTLQLDKFFENQDIVDILHRIEQLDLGNDEQQAVVAYSSIGYVYAAWNPLFRDLIKIGFTWRQPIVRVRELSGTGVPEPFQLISFLCTKAPFRLEQDIHRHFEAVRKYGRKKEFFVLSQDQIHEYFHMLSLMGDKYKNVQALHKEMKSSDIVHTKRGGATLKKNIKSFVTKFIVPSEDESSALSTNELMLGFKQRGYGTCTITQFGRVLASQLFSSHSYSKKIRNKKWCGYSGIKLKPA
jgi:hypothetical protein